MPITFVNSEIFQIKISCFSKYLTMNITKNKPKCVACVCVALADITSGQLAMMLYTKTSELQSQLTTLE